MPLAARPATPIIAIIDDDAMLRDSLDSLVRSCGYQARAFARPDTFLAQRLELFACLILDVNLPGMSGLHLQSLLRGRAPNLPVLIVSGFPAPGTRDHALAAGACLFLEKPFDPDVLLAEVRRLVERRPHG